MRRRCPTSVTNCTTSAGTAARSACHGPDRSHLILPGFRSSRIHVVNVADDPRRPRIEKVIEPEEVVRKTGYTRPHTAHCMPGGNVVVSMLGDAEGNGAGGFAMLDAETFELKGRWENGGETPPLNYDFWYQPRKNVLSHPSSASRTPTSLGSTSQMSRRGATGTVSTSGIWPSGSWSRPSTSVRADCFRSRSAGSTIPRRRKASSALRSRARCGASDAGNGGWTADQVIAVEPVELEGWPFPVPGVMSDLVLSMDDRFLYFSNWLHGDLRQYDVSDPANPKLTGRLWLGGVLGKASDAGRELNGGPQMLQLSLRRSSALRQQLAATRPGTTSSTPASAHGSCASNCAPDGGMEVDRDFFVDFHDRPDGPARAHEVRLQNGDCTTEIFQ